MVFEPLHQNYFSCSRIFFSSTVGLVGGGFIGGEFFAASDSGEFLVQIELPKMHRFRAN
jgi:multidrug efflux pump subunit AcrB